jgi:hypothetical protein
MESDSARLHITDGTADDFEIEIGSPIRAFRGRSIDIGAGFEGMMTPFNTAGEFLVDCCSRSLLLIIRALSAVRTGLARLDSDIQRNLIHGATHSVTLHSANVCVWT